MNISFFESTYRLINKYNQKGKEPKTYGTEDLLYVAEVHMLEIIGSYGQITTTQLAQALGITKGAVSQTTNKLMNKAMIHKNPSPERGNEVYISLSEKGKTVFDYHRKMHSDMLEQIYAEIAKLPPESVETVNKIIAIIDGSLDKI